MMLVPVTPSILVYMSFKVFSHILKIIKFSILAIINTLFYLFLLINELKDRDTNLKIIKHLHIKQHL